MNDHDLDVLLRQSLERDAATQPLAVDLHQRSVAYGNRVVRRRRAAMGTASAAVVALVAILGFAVSQRKDTPPSAPMPPTLSSVITHVRALPAENLPTTGDWFVQLRADLNGKPAVGQAWFAPDGTERELLGETTVSTQQNSGTQILPWPAIAALPVQPADLMARLRRSAISIPGYAVSDDTTALMESTGRLLGEAPTSPVLRAAMLEGLGDTSGVQVRGTARDVLGNVGLALAHTVSGATYRLLVSPSTGRVLQVDYDSATEHDTETYVAQTAVSDDHATPPGFQVVRSTPTPTPASAVTALGQVADRVKGLSGAAQATSPWWYDRIDTTTGGTTSIGQRWQSRDGVTLALIDGKPATTPVDGFLSGNVGKGASWAANAGYPTDAATIYGFAKQQALAGLGSDAPAAALDADMVSQLVHLLEQAEFTPAQRAGVLGALGRVEGVSVGGTAQDGKGRSGELIVPPDVGFTAGMRYILDPTSGLILEAQKVDARGTIVTRTTFVTSAPVAAERALPAGSAELVAAPEVVDHPPSAAFLAAVALQTSETAGPVQLSLPSDISGAWVTDLEGTLPDGTELVVGSYSGIADPRPSVWFTGTGSQVLEAGLGDPVKKVSGVTEYVLHGTKNQGDSAPWTWVLVRARASTTKVQVSAGPLWKNVPEMDGVAILPTSELAPATSRVRLFAGGASPYFTGHLSVLPASRP